MWIIKENYIIADDLIQNGALYVIHNNENLNDINIQSSPDDTNNVYLCLLQYESFDNLKSLLTEGITSLTSGLAGKGLKVFTFHRDVNSFITILNSERK